MDATTGAPAVGWVRWLTREKASRLRRFHRSNEAISAKIMGFLKKPEKMIDQIDRPDELAFGTLALRATGLYRSYEAWVKTKSKTWRDVEMDLVKKAPATGWRFWLIREQRLSGAPRFVGHTLEHTRYVNSLAWLPGGKLASGSGDKTIKIWDVATGKCELTLEGHTGRVLALVVLPNDRLASGSADNTIRIWDVTTGRCMKKLQDESWDHCYGFEKYRMNSLAALPGGKLASASNRPFVIHKGKWGEIHHSYDRSIEIWDVETGRCERTLPGHAGVVKALAVLPGGNLVSGSRDATIKIWDVATGQCVDTLKGHTNHVNALAVLSDGKLASASRDRTIKIWDLETGQSKGAQPPRGWRRGWWRLLGRSPPDRASSSRCVNTLEGHTNGVSTLAALPDGRLASASRLDGTSTTLIWDVAMGECDFEIRDSKGGWRDLLAASRDGTLAEVTDNDAVRIWHPAPVEHSPAFAGSWKNRRAEREGRGP